MKNVVVLHLESLSHELMRLFPEEVATIIDLYNRSVRFPLFFSSATSSIMVLAHLLHGTPSRIDHFLSFDEDNVLNGSYGDDLATVFRGAGYSVSGVGYPLIWRDDLSRFRLWDPNGESFQWLNDQARFRSAIREVISAPGDKPFFLYVWDLRSHLYYTDSQKESDGPAGPEWIAAGYRCLDATVKYVIEQLQAANKLEETIILGFGDHGDEWWVHGLNAGFCHAIEPYTSLIWTPAFVHDPGSGSRSMEGLASLVDLKKTLLSMVGIGIPPSMDSQGLDLTTEKRSVAFSQNLFANQKPDASLAKAFSATNDSFHLIAGEQGLELYDYRLDPSNHNNLLSFFDLRANGLTFKPRGASHVHFKKVMTDKYIRNVVTNFTSLKKYLEHWVRAKYESLGDGSQYPFDMECFHRVRPRIYLWERPCSSGDKSVVLEEDPLMHRFVTGLKSRIRRFLA